MEEDNNLYYNNEVVECEVLSCDYKDGSYYLEVRPYTDDLWQIQCNHEGYKSKLVFRGNNVMLRYFEPDFDKIDWNIELYILPKTIL